MKKTMLKSTKSFIIAVAVCAGLALGILANVATTDSSVAYAAPPFIDANY